jgi:hypothetical protein
VVEGEWEGVENMINSMNAIISSFGMNNVVSSIGLFFVIIGIFLVFLFVVTGNHRRNKNTFFIG